MNASDSSFISVFFDWLANYYLAATLLLGLAFVTWRCIRQPAHRLLVAWAVVVELMVLAAVCALPFWPRISLRPAAPQPTVANLPAVERQPESASWFIFEERRQRFSDDSTIAADAGPQTPPQVGILARLGLDKFRPTRIELTVAGYLAGAALVGLWLCWGAAAAMRICRQAQPASDVLQA